MDYRESFYKYQTKARGVLDAGALERRFTRLAKWYKSRLRNRLPKNREAKCIDIPCGYGNFLYFLRSLGYSNIRGCDLDENQIELSKLLGLPTETCDGFDILRSSNGGFDLISSMDFIEHLDKNEALAFLQLCRDKLSETGVVIIRTPCADGPFGAHDANNDITHEWSLTSNCLKTTLEMLGYTRVEILDERPQPTSAIGVIRWLTFFPSRAVANSLCFCLGMIPPRVWSRSMIAIAHK